MADTTSITSANAIVTWVVAGLFAAPVQLQGFSAERAWNSDQLDLAEIQMGVDGRMTAGWTPNPVGQTYSFQADSPSKSIVLAIARAMASTKDIYYITANITLPSTGENYIGTRGVLQNIKPIVDAGKVLQAADYKVVWEALSSSLI